MLKSWIGFRSEWLALALSLSHFIFALFCTKTFRSLRTQILSRESEIFSLFFSLNFSPQQKKQRERERENHSQYRTHMGHQQQAAALIDFLKFPARC
jgi:hypothetical protein